MVERHIIRPSAGRMRPNTSESGIFSTKRRSPVSTSMLTRILVPNPKKAFQSPGVHKVGRADVVEGMAASCQILVPVNKLDLDGNSEACGRAAIAPEVKPDVPNPD